MKAMIKITEVSARGLLMLQQEVYALYPDGSEAIIEGGLNDLWQYKGCKYGLEGELFGAPYEEIN